MAFTKNQTIVVEYYIAALGRTPEQGGFDFWTTQLDAGMTPAALMTQLLNRDFPEVAARYPAGQTNVQTIENFYQGVFGRASDTAGSAYWAEKLTTLSETEVLAEMLAAAKNSGNETDAKHLADKQAEAQSALKQDFHF